VQVVTQIKAHGFNVHLAASENIQRGEVFFGPSVQAKMGFGQQKEAGDSLWLKLVKALGQYGGSGSLNRRCKNFRPIRHVGQASGMRGLKPQIKQKVLPG
jgi:hypothetical protein